MVIAATTTMEEGRILLVGNETDILHSAFPFPINEGGKRYPSAEHYAHAQILTQLNLDEVHILSLLATANVNVSKKAKELLRENMPSGHDMNSLSQYLTVSRQSYTMMGLRLRAEQDKRFRQTLMETGDALLIVCDQRDSELGVGMDDDKFVQFARRRHANAERISGWMHDERQRPKELGQNQLGFFLMWLRYELREKEKAKWLSTTEIKAEGLTASAADSQEEKQSSQQISISDFVLALEGPFQPLSNYYALIFELKGCIYRSVEHYAYQRLFEALKLPEEEVMKIRTTVKPVDVAKCAKRLFEHLKLDPADVEHKSARLDRWRQSAMKHKITKNEYLQKLLLSTGHALLLETTFEADPKWSCGTDEFEFQHLLTKRYVSPQLLIDWQCGRTKFPPSLAHMGGNRSGLLLMQLRAKLTSSSTHRIPLISPLTSSVLRSSVSNHMICFSPESVFHPFYPTEIRLNDTTTFPSAAHMAANMAINYLGVNQPDSKWIMEPKDAPECWERLHTVICHQMQLPLDKIQQWYTEERQIVLKEAMKLQFDQNPPLLRALLDTQDALLVSCARFSTPEAELNIGLRERDLRLWLSQVHQDSKQLMDICLRPMAFRPPYVGGNRIGFMLMELRREFILSGIFPHQLPELPQNVDSLLGSESPMENYVATAPFDVLDEANFTAIWANPYLLMLKQQLENGAMGLSSGPAESVEALTEHWEKAAMSKKLAPLLISRDEPQITALFERIFIQKQDDSAVLQNGYSNGLVQSSTDPPSLDEMAPEMLRSLYMKMATQFRQKLFEIEEMQREIGVRSRDNNRLQELLRNLERSREMKTKMETAAQQQQAQNQPPLQQQQSTIPGAGPPPTAPIMSMAQQPGPGTGPPPPLHPLPDSSVPNLAQQQPLHQPQDSSAQWTQAAAISSGTAGRRQSPPPRGPGGGGGQMPMHPGTHPIADGDGPAVGSAPVPMAKIPSLFEVRGPPNQGQPNPQPPLPPPQHYPPPHGRVPLPPQLSTTQPFYSGGGGRRGGEHPHPPSAFPDRRGGPPPSARWERGRRGGGGRRGFGGGPPLDRSRSRSPLTIARRRADRTPPRHHRQPPSGQSQHPPLPYHKSQQPISRGEARPSVAGTTSSTSPQQPKAPTIIAAPAVKKPKRVVDESELSEGEILSDEEG